MNNLRPVNAKIIGLVGKRISYTHREDWLLPLVYYNVLLKVVVIPDTILLPESDRILLSPQHIAQVYPINSKSREGFKAIVHHNR